MRRTVALNVRRFFRRGIGFLFCALVAHGSSWVQASRPANDTCAQAAPLVLDTPVTGSTAECLDDYRLSGSTCFTGVGHTASTAPGRDIVYSFTAPDADTYSFRVTGYSSTTGNLVLYTSTACEGGAPPVVLSSCQAGANRQSQGSAEEVMCVALTADQTVYAYVDEHAGTAGASFTIEVNRCTLETEPNNTVATASRLGCPVEGSVGISDGDAYGVGSFASGSRLFAIADGVAASSTDFRMDLYSGATQTVMERDEDDNDVEFGTLSPNIAGAALNLASPIIGMSGSASSEPYRLYSVVQPPSSTATPESEPNDTNASADSSPNNYFSGTSSSSSDVDLFSFSASAGDLIVLGLDGDPDRTNQGRNFDLALLDSLGLVLVSVTDPNSTTSTTMPPSAPGEGLVHRAMTTGNYFARVTRSGGGGGSALYLLSIAIDCRTFPGTDLNVTKSDSDDTVLPGAGFSYLLTVTNEGPATARNVILSDPLPGGVSFVSATPSAGSCSGTSTVTCLLGDVPDAGVVTVTIAVTAGSSDGFRTNRCSVTSNDFDPDAIDDAAEVTTVVSDGDFDDDGTVDAIDCAPFDGHFQSLPGEVRDLRLAHDDTSGVTSLSWTAPLVPGGEVVVYNAVRSTTASDFTTNWLCVYSDGLGMSADDPDPNPIPAGEVYFYLVRAENPCGFGSAGTNTAGAERSVHDCP